MPYLTCTMISSVDPAHNGVSPAKDWVSVGCGTMFANRRPRFCESCTCCKIVLGLLLTYI